MHSVLVSYSESLYYFSYDTVAVYSIKVVTLKLLYGIVKGR